MNLKDTANFNLFFIVGLATFVDRLAMYFVLRSSRIEMFTALKKMLQISFYGYILTPFVALCSAYWFVNVIDSQDVASRVSSYIFIGVHSVFICGILFDNFLLLPSV